MNKAILMSTVLLCILSCGTKYDEKKSTQISVSTAALSASTYSGGMIFYAFGPKGELNFSKIVSSDQLDLVLNNGEWTFAIAAWEGTNPMEGTTRCAVSSEKLIGGSQDLGLDLKTANCDHGIFSPTEALDSNGYFSELKLHSCTDFIGVNNPGDSCTTGIHSSFKISFSEHQNGVLGNSLLSVCLTNPLATNLKIPAGGSNRSNFKMKIFAYQAANCTGTSDLYDFPFGPHRVNFENSNNAKFLIGTNENHLYLK